MLTSVDSGSGPHGKGAAWGLALVWLLRTMEFCRAVFRLRLSPCEPVFIQSMSLRQTPNTPACPLFAVRSVRWHTNQDQVLALRRRGMTVAQIAICALPHRQGATRTQKMSADRVCSVSQCGGNKGECECLYLAGSRSHPFQSSPAVLRGGCRSGARSTPIRPCCASLGTALAGTHVSARCRRPRHHGVPAGARTAPGCRGIGPTCAVR